MVQSYRPTVHNAKAFRGANAQEAAGIETLSNSFEGAIFLHSNGFPSRHGRTFFETAENIVVSGGFSYQVAIVAVEGF